MIWNQTWGGDNFDYGRGIAVDREGNTYISGDTKSFGPGIPTYTNAFLVKYDNSGAQQWNATWGGDNADTGERVAVDGEGNIYIVGWTNNFGPGTPDYSNALLVKYDSSGAQQWNATWGGDYAESGYGVAVDGEGNIYIAGNTRSFGPGTPDTGNAFLAKYDSSGTQKWNLTWGGDDWDGAEGVAVDGEDNAYIGGATNGFGPGTPDYSNAFLAKYNSSGVQQWNATWGGDDTDNGKKVAVDGEGNAYIGGYTNSFGPGTPLYSNAFLVKYDSSGTQQWNATWGGDDRDMGWGVAADGEGNSYIGGSTQSFGPGIPTENNAFLTKYDNSGAQQWNLTWGADENEGCYTIAMDGEGNIYIVGFTESFGPGTPDYSNAFLAKFRDLPGHFNLYTDAGNPDNDGWFILNWGTSKNADTYSVLVYNTSIKEINQSVPVLEEDMTRRSYALLGLHSGTYYFIVVACNDNGYTITNCVQVVVLIAACGEESSGGGSEGGGSGGGSGGGGTGGEIPPEAAFPLIILWIGVPLAAAGGVAVIILLLKKKASLTQ